MMEAGMLLAGRYRLKRKLGHGAFGEVWRAADVRGSQDIAIKVMISTQSDSVAFQRFEREADIVRDLRHPGIVRVHGSGWYRSQMYFVMELLEGPGDLAKVMSENTRGLPATQAVDLAIQIANALSSVHAKDIIHRDIKPANLFVQGGYQLKILDFGIARDFNLGTITVPGTVVGSPAYMAPELWEGKRATVKSDLYALGCVLYEMLTGRSPFAGGSSAPLRLYERHKRETPRSPSARRQGVPASLDPIVLGLLAKEPVDRPASADDVARQLREAMRPGNRGRRGQSRPAIAADPVAGGMGQAIAADSAPAVPARAPATIACASASRGDLELFVLTGNAIRQRRLGPRSASADWRTIGPPMSGVRVIAAGSHDENHAELAAVVRDTVYHKQWMNERPSDWDPRAPLGTEVIDVAFASMIPGYLKVFALDQTGRVRFSAYPENYRWSEWRDMELPATEPVIALAAGSPSREREDLFVIAGGLVWQRTWSRADNLASDWGPWQPLPLPGERVVDLACASSDAGYIALFALDATGSVYFRSLSPQAGWASWSGLSGRDDRGLGGRRVEAIAAGWHEDSRQAALFTVTGADRVHCAWWRLDDPGSPIWIWQDLSAV